MILIVMGVCGSGKTTIGKTLSNQLQWEFADGDDFHSEGNIKKMSSGIPLNDDDRQSWLVSIHQQVNKWLSTGKNGVIACSALKRSYRNILRHGSSLNQMNHKDVKFLYLQGSYEVFYNYLSKRTGHFMPPKLLASQLEILEEPDETEGITVAASQTVNEICQNVVELLKSIEK